MLLFLVPKCYFEFNLAFNFQKCYFEFMLFNFKNVILNAYILYFNHDLDVYIPTN